MRGWTELEREFSSLKRSVPAGATGPSLRCRRRRAVWSAGSCPRRPISRPQRHDGALGTAIGAFISISGGNQEVAHASTRRCPRAVCGRRPRRPARRSLWPESGPGACQRRGSRPVIRVSTELVQVDAVVTDKQGRQVTNLTAKDFEIVEDGIKRPITHFRYVSFEPLPLPTPTVPAASRLPPPTRETTKRTLAIVFDDLSLSFQGQVWARQALHRLVAERMGAGDLVSIVRTGGGIGNLQQFTNDKRLLDAAIEGVRFDPATWAN